MLIGNVLRRQFPLSTAEVLLEDMGLVGEGAKTPQEVRSLQWIHQSMSFLTERLLTKAN